MSSNYINKLNYMDIKPEFKILTFKVYKDPEEWYAKSHDSLYVVGYTLDFAAPSREDLHRQIILEINDIFFQEYDIDFFMSEPNLIEVLLSRGVPIINTGEIN